jgi:chromosomal replication initiation ATPase DnaA
MTEPPPGRAGEQLPFDFGWRPALDRDAFLITAANAPAVAWIDRWPDWAGYVLALVGQPGSGKTHLASVWQARSGADAIDGAGLTAATVPTLLAHGRPLVVEAADDAPAEPLLHLFNGMVEARTHLLLTACLAPARWPVGLADLASRLKTVPVAAIPDPDDLLLRAVLVKMFADRHLGVGADVLDYLQARLERSFDAARRMVGLLDTTGLARQRPITVSLARSVLAGMADRPTDISRE